MSNISDAEFPWAVALLVIGTVGNLILISVIYRAFRRRR